MTTPTDIKSQIRRDEGLRLKPYQCTGGKTTIGYGRNLDDVGISEAEAERMLTDDIYRVIAALENRWEWFAKLDDARRGVLINMAFNLGMEGLAGFKKTLAEISIGHYHYAAMEMLDSRWAEQVGDRAKRLARQMELGEWQ